MGKTIGKSKEIFDAKIQFVSLVDYAANKRKFLLAKAKDGQNTFSSCGKIIQKNSDSHYVTGIVYEPMTADTDDEFMTEEEIQKAAYYYAENFQKVDLQHNFVPCDGCKVVETWVAKADFSLGNEDVKKGTWLMTVKIVNDDLWTAVEKGEITGFSMGGACNVAEEDTDLSMTKNGDAAAVSSEQENKGLLAKIAKALGFKMVEKGDVAEIYSDESKSNNFWAAESALERTLRHYDSYKDKYVYEEDEEKVREALTEFSNIVTNILTGSVPVANAIVGPESDTEQPVNKETEKPKEAEKTIEKEETEVTKAQVEEIISKAIAKALTPETPAEEPAEKQTAPEEVEKSEKQEELTPELVEQMVTEAITKAQQPEEQPEEKLTAEDVQEMIAKAVEAAIEPIRKANHLPSNLNGEEVKKNAEEEHFLHGIL